MMKFVALVPNSSNLPKAVQAGKIVAGGVAHMGLTLRFNIILVACYLVGLGLCLWPFYQMSRREALEQLQSQIDVLRAEALAIRKYTSDEIQPLLDDQSAIQFLPQTIPAFSAQTVFRNFKSTNPQYFYKEAALNPTNPADLAKDWEPEVIEKLSANPQIDKDVSIRTNEAGPQFTVAYPMVIKDPGCLACHSTPDKAPASMVALYGANNGFGWKLNQTVVAQIISIPISVADAKVWRDLTLFVGITSAVFLVMLIVLQVLLNRYVIAPVNRMARVAEAYSMGEPAPTEFEYKGTDEVASLSRSFNRMRRSLDVAMKMLDK
jgi:protein-histidine pros-kinase